MMEKRNLKNHRKIGLIQNLYSLDFKPVLYNSYTLFSDTVKSFLYDFFGKVSSDRFIQKYSSKLHMPAKDLISNPVAVQFVLSDCFDDDVSFSLMKQIHLLFSKRISNFFQKFSLETKFDELNKAEITKHMKKLQSAKITLVSNSHATKKQLFNMFSFQNLDLDSLKLEDMNKTRLKQLSKYDVVVLDSPLLIFKKSR